MPPGQEVLSSAETSQPAEIYCRELPKILWERRTQSSELVVSSTWKLWTLTQAQRLGLNISAPGAQNRFLIQIVRLFFWFGELSGQKAHDLLQGLIFTCPLSFSSAIGNLSIFSYRVMTGHRRSNPGHLENNLNSTFQFNQKMWRNSNLCNSCVWGLCVYTCIYKIYCITCTGMIS